MSFLWFLENIALLNLILLDAGTFNETGEFKYFISLISIVCTQMKMKILSLKSTLMNSNV